MTTLPIQLPWQEVFPTGKKTKNAHKLNFEHDVKATPVGFEPTRGDPIGLAGRRLNRSAKVSYDSIGEAQAKHQTDVRMGMGRRRH